MKRPFRLVTLFLVLAVTVVDARAETDFERAYGKLAASRKNDRDCLHALLELHWEYTLRESPEFATEVGHPGHDHRWSDHDQILGNGALPLDVLETRIKAWVKMKKSV